MKEIEPIKPLDEAQADWTFKSGQRCTSARLLLSKGYVSKLKRIPANHIDTYNKAIHAKTRGRFFCLAIQQLTLSRREKNLAP